MGPSEGPGAHWGHSPPTGRIYPHDHSCQATTSHGAGGVPVPLRYPLSPGEEACLRVPGALRRRATGPGPAVHLHLPTRPQGQRSPVASLAPRVLWTLCSRSRPRERPVPGGTAWRPVPTCLAWGGSVRRGPAGPSEGGGQLRRGMRHGVGAQRPWRSSSEEPVIMAAANRNHLSP